MAKFEVVSKYENEGILKTGSFLIHPQIWI